MTVLTAIKVWFWRRKWAALFLLAVLVWFITADFVPGGFWGVLEQRRLFAEQAKELELRMKKQEPGLPQKATQKYGETDSGGTK